MLHSTRLAAFGILAASLALAAAYAADAPRVSTTTPFKKGDILVASTVMNDPDDDHAGIGRIFQYDADLNLKGELWLEGSAHKVGGLAFGPDGTLWASAPLDPVMMEVGRDGRQRPLRRFSDRSFSSVTFARDGTLYFGEHLQGKVASFPSFTTKFHYLPGRDVIGDGVIEHFTADGKLLQSWKVATHGGMLGFHAVTSTVLTDDDTRMVYISETGNAIKQFDLKNSRQLPDLAVFESDPKVPMVLVMVAGVDGRLMVSTGGGFFIADPKTGAIIRQYPLEGMGWAALAPTVDGQGAIVGNFFTGDVVRINLADGSVTGRANIGQTRSLSGIAQFPG
jgi:outer membrane protein assembly factor BamB